MRTYPSRKLSLKILNLQLIILTYMKCCYKKLRGFFIGVWLIYNVVLVSGVQQSELGIHILKQICLIPYNQICAILKRGNFIISASYDSSSDTAFPGGLSKTPVWFLCPEKLWINTASYSLSSALGVKFIKYTFCFYK